MEDDSSDASSSRDTHDGTSSTVTEELHDGEPVVAPDLHSQPGPALARRKRKGNQPRVTTEQVRYDNQD